VRTSYILVRSPNVPAATNYSEYEPLLRSDFFYSCGYCSTAESEAVALGFETEHYVPIAADPSLEHVYDNLIWACQHCNDKKGAWHPPPEAAAAGHLFFRPDRHDPTEHFKIKGVLVEGLTPMPKILL